MTKYLLLLTLLVLTKNLSAQKEIGNKSLSWGIKIGGNASIPKSSYTSNFAEVLGIYLQTKLTKSPWSFQTEILYKVTAVGRTYGDITLRTSSIELPVSVKFLFTKRVTFFAGLAPSIPYYSETIIGKITKFTPPVNLSYFLGIGILIPTPENRFGLDFRYCGYVADNFAYSSCNRGGGCGIISNQTSTFDVALTCNFR
jgi:hypothetical protein